MRTAGFEKCLAKFDAKATAWKEWTCKVSEGDDPSAPVVNAHLLYKVIPEADLDKVWDMWIGAVSDQKLMETFDQADGKKQLPAKQAAHVAGLLVTRRPGLEAGKVFVVVYFPGNNDPANGQGRGHFVLVRRRGAPLPRCEHAWSCVHGVDASCSLPLAPPPLHPPSPLTPPSPLAARNRPQEAGQVQMRHCRNEGRRPRVRLRLSDIS